MTDFNVQLQWDESSMGRHGDGISRPQPSMPTREYRLIIYSKGGTPMTWVTRAETKKHAIKYAQARWPGAVVEVA